MLSSICTSTRHQNWHFLHKSIFDIRFSFLCFHGHWSPSGQRSECICLASPEVTREENSFFSSHAFRQKIPGILRLRQQWLLASISDDKQLPFLATDTPLGSSGHTSNFPSFQIEKATRVKVTSAGLALDQRHILELSDIGHRDDGGFGDWQIRPSNTISKLHTP